MTGRQLHFVGLGGAGMSGLALLCAAAGAQVSGSDRADSAYLARLRERGIDPVIGHDAENVPAGAEVIYSTAIDAANPELAVARQLRHRSDLMAEIAALRRCVAVSGTHGKTTTSAMIVQAMRGAGLDPSYLIGGELRAMGVNAGWGAGEWIVVEADESDRSLLKLAPELAVLTNAELDHHATYSSRLDVEETFRRFLASSGRAIVWDRPALTALAPPDAVRYDATPELSSTGSSFLWREQTVKLYVPGAHNAVNAAGALEAARLAGADPAAAAGALSQFKGARRRFEQLGRSASGALLVDDYAHHPTEIAATLAAARTLGARRLIAVAQPHLFSRTRALAGAYGQALAAADLVVVIDVYPSRERAEDFPGIDGRLVATSVADAAGGRTVAWLPKSADAHRYLTGLLRVDDLCLLMGAGDIDVLGRSLVGA